MTRRSSARGSWWRQAPALRFLAIFLLGWVGLRAVFPLVPIFWSDDVSARAVAVLPTGRVVGAAKQHATPPDAMLTQHSAIGDWAVSDGQEEGVRLAVHPADRHRAVAVRKGQSVGLGRKAGVGTARSASHAAPPPLVLAENADIPLGRGTAWAPARGPAIMSLPSETSVAARPAIMTSPFVPAAATDGQGSGTRADRLSASTWIFLRDNLARRTNSLPVAGELGGSQAGLRVAYELGGAQAWQAYGRGSMALGHVKQSEGAIGISAAPIAALPVRVAVERRQKLGRDGRSAMAAMAVGGVSGQSLPANFRLDAYGQAGVVGLRSRDAFVDGAVVIDRAVSLSNEAESLRLGVVAAGAAQPYVSRLDMGPRVTLPVPKFGKGMRLSVDWRYRVAGNAQPKSGAALTVGADF